MYVECKCECAIHLLNSSVSALISLVYASLLRPIAFHISAVFSLAEAFCACVRFAFFQACLISGTTASSETGESVRMIGLVELAEIAGIAGLLLGRLWLLEA